MEKIGDSAEKAHKLKISVDIRSIKDQEFLGQIFVKYPAIPELNIKTFRNSPTLAISSARVEQQIPNAFASYYFEATADSISKKMTQTLEVEVWHSDRLKKDALLGIARVDLSQIMTLALRKTRESYARVFDGYVPVDMVDDDRKPQKKIAALRVIVYLEDLGPVALLKENQEKFGLKPLENDDGANANIAVPPSYQPDSLNADAANPAPFNDIRQLQLNELEYKVVWELETWKKAEQAKAKILLKQKEVEFWSQLSEQQKKNDLEKQKYFKKIEANLTLLEGKLRAKAGQLQKREQKIVLLEQELQAKVSEVSKQLFGKDEELEQLRKKSKEDKQNAAKEKAALDLEIQKLRNQNAKIRADFEQASKQDDKSPLFIIKTELTAKNMQLRELSRQCEKALETKQQYRVYYEKMRNQVVRLKAELDKRQQGSQSLRFQNQLLKNNLKNLQQQMATAMSQQQQQQQYYMAAQAGAGQQPQPQQFSSQIERLKWQRQHLLDSGVYSVNDPLIKEFDKLIGSN